MSEELEGAHNKAESAQNAMTMLEMISGYWVTQILRATAELSLVDHVTAGASTAEEIAAREGTDPATTYRLLRAGASIGLFGDAGDRRFRVTPLGGLLRKGAPGSLREMAIVQGSPLHWQSWGVLPDAVRKGGTQMQAALGLAEGETQFDYFGRNPEEGAYFAAAMSNATGVVIDDVTRMLDLEGVSLAIDVGGSTGALVQSLMKTRPGLTGMVLDLPHVMDSAVRAAEEAGVLDRFSAVPGDFFKEVPAADLYLLKMVLHDWDDEQCVQILRNCRASAKPGTRGVVIEAVVGRIGEPSFGALLDMNMLAGTTGQERDFDAYDALYAASGWRRTSTLQTSTPWSVQEIVAV
ncbi:acetylserotonin O-methyltransferase [Streptacidiphilus sp. ASG 303]|uniref:acetylserotonin O-methyltransferase n=1 Tax=Streptacidiphilus sp. ASG 303 TaxID=2896847 RepID=UPI001E4A86A0|nr:acetylserotonin O-methyltransferase [Streptacidiphilus sp. ASG 303]MCD0482598.1 acetylserotonin O-methyltransferase [Streptacidiphilus sp. ASG 303]